MPQSAEMRAFKVRKVCRTSCVAATDPIGLCWAQPHMGRNLYILAGTLAFFALVSLGLSYSNLSQQPGSPGDASLWRFTGLVLLVVALVVALAGVLSALFEQAERRSDEARQSARRRSSRLDR